MPERSQNGSTTGSIVPDNVTVPNPAQADIAGAADEAVGNLDEEVGGTIQDTADNLGSGPGELVDSLASESVAQAAVRSQSDTVAVAETAANAAEVVTRRGTNSQAAVIAVAKAAVANQCSSATIRSPPRRSA